MLIRGAKLWLEAVPGLLEHPALIRLRNPQNRSITTGKCGEGYRQIKSIVVSDR